MKSFDDLPRMNLKAHHYFTRVPQASFRAFFSRHGLTLEAVLVALAVDPKWAQVTADNYVLADVPHSLDYFATVDRHAQRAAIITIAQWAANERNAEEVLRAMAKYDLSLCTWCACQVAREVMHFVPRGEERPLAAITAAEGWVRGKDSRDGCRDASSAAHDAAGEMETLSSAAFACEAAANAAICLKTGGWMSYVAPDAAADTAKDAARAMASSRERAGSENWNFLASLELVRFCEVVANACLSYPKAQRR